VIGKGKRRPKPADLPSIIEDVADGLSLRKACEKAGLNVSHTHTAIDADQALREHYARAREQRAEGIAEQILTVANGALTGRIDSDRARVAIDAFKWTAGKMAPKRYGDKITNEHTGPDGGPVEITRVERVVVNPSDPNR
jgi:hypothetical protein